jgi:hypothetical protein
MRKLLLLSLIIFSSCASHVWAVSQEQYDKYHTAKMNGNFGEIMEVVNHIIATEDPNKLTIDDFDILATGLGYSHQFGYKFTGSEIESIGAFLKWDEKGSVYTTKTVLWYEWMRGFEPTDYEGDNFLFNWDAWSSKDAQGGASPAVIHLINWKLGKRAIEQGKFVKAEMRYLKAVTHGTGKEDPWDSALWMSRLSALYHYMGKTDLSLKAAKHTNELLKLLPSQPHLYLAEIIENIVTVSALNGIFDASEVYLSILKLRDKSNPEYLNRSSELVISSMEAYIALRNEDNNLLAKARQRYENSGYIFTTIDGEYFLNYVQSYIDDNHANICETSHGVTANAIKDAAVTNVLLALELNRTSLCGKVSQFKNVLKLLTKQAQEDKEPTYKGLSRSTEPNGHSVWYEKLILKSLLNLQEREGNFDEELSSQIIDLFLQLESSPAERELAAIASAKKTKSPKNLTNVRTYFNMLRERDVYLPKLLDIYTQRTLIMRRENYPLDKSFEHIPASLQYSTLNARKNAQEFISQRVKNTHRDIIKNLLPNQATIFNIENDNIQLSCLVSGRKTHCEVTTLPKDFSNVQEQIIHAIKTKSLRAAQEAIKIISAIKFPKKLTLLTNDYSEIFYVPTSNDWNLPINLIWRASDIPANLIISPTLNSLTIEESVDNGGVIKYAYTGIGNPNYSTRLIASLANIEAINGFTLRSGDYIQELSQLSQLPATEEEIKLSEKEFSGLTKIMLGENAAEENLLDTDWYDSKVIHFASHALISGEMKGLQEPALALSTPKFNSYSDGLLTATDIRAYDFPGSTVVLSGCRTATDYGKSSKQGITGLSLAFLVQGANNLIVTQWQIPDDFSAEMISKVMANLSKSSTSDSLSQLMDTASARKIDPYNWAAYLFLSTPSRYNQKRIQTGKILSTNAISRLDDTELDISQTQIDGIHYIAVKSSNEDWSKAHTQIFKVQNSQLEEVSEIEDFRASFIGVPEGRFMLFESNAGIWIAKFDNSFTQIQKKIKLVDATYQMITNYTAPLYIEKGFVFAYRSEKPGATYAEFKLLNIDYSLENILETDIEEEIMDVETPPDYERDWSWTLSKLDGKVTLAISRTFSEEIYDAEYGSDTHDFVEHSHFYEFSEDNKLISTYYLPDSKIFEALKPSSDSYIAAIGNQANLGIISSKGEILTSNTQLANVVYVDQFKSSKGNLISAQTMSKYSNDGYYEILKTSNELKVSSKKSLDEEPISENADGVSYLKDIKWMYQTSIVNSDSKDLRLQRISPTSPSARSLLGYIEDGSTTSNFKIVNFNRIEHEVLVSEQPGL